MSINLSALMKQRYDTAANWTAQNPTLLAGEIGIESDTKKWKVGTGSTAWISLTYAIGGTYPIVNADIAAGAAIAYSKLATLTSGNIVLGSAANVAISTAVTGDVTISNTGVTAIALGVIVNADVSASAAIEGSKIVPATTSVVGAVQLTDSTASTSTTTAATPAAVKVAKDAADAAQSTANAALPKAGGTITGNVDNTATGYFDLPVGTTAERPGSPNSGMIRYNSLLGQFEGYGTAWGTIGGGAKGGGSDDVFYENGQTVTTNYTITTNKNAMTAGPVTVNSGIVVTIPSGSSWVIV